MDLIDNVGYGPSRIDQLPGGGQGWRVVMRQPSFTLVQLRYFAAAAEHGSMTAAARELIVSQSAVSTAIAQLEKELGVQLLLRHHARGLSLTAAGRAFFTELNGFLAHSQELAESATNAGRSLAGELSVGFFDTLAPFLLPELVGNFKASHPGVHLTVVEGEHAAVKRSLRSGECEVAVMYDYALEEDLLPTRIGVAAPYVIVGRKHRLARRKRVRLSELADEPMVLLDLPYTAAYFLSLFVDLDLEAQVLHRSHGFETVRAMVASGYGFSLLNQRPANPDTYGGQGVVSLEISDELRPLDIVAVQMRDSRTTRKGEAFIQTCLRLS